MLTIAEALTPQDLAQIRADLAAAPWRDGRRTAGGSARKAKANSQADGDNPKVAALGRFVRQALERQELFVAFARPGRWSPVMFNRYREGEAYGLHVDDAVMGKDAAQIRTDLSFTVFLSEPETYEGGELVLDGVDGERWIKPPAGAVALYPTGALHKVAPVTRGERLAAVGWIQSLVRRADEREILFDLARARAGFPEGEARLLLDKAAANLVRLWAEP